MKLFFALMAISFFSNVTLAKGQYRTLHRYHMSFARKYFEVKLEGPLSLEEQAGVFCKALDNEGAHRYVVGEKIPKAWDPYGRRVEQYTTISVKLVNGKPVVEENIVGMRKDIFTWLVCYNSNPISETKSYTTYKDRHILAWGVFSRDSRKAAYRSCRALGHKDVASYKVKKSLRYVKGWYGVKNSTADGYTLDEISPTTASPYSSDRYFSVLVCKN